ncbi:MAG: hypothetical protein QF812_02840 [Nitrososphaerales archaeon]|nr:hypothetical protein [Nitrososphaerales archaeon]
MKIFPREHGVTVIWFASILTAFLTMSTYPSILNILFFLFVSFTILILMAQMTRLKLIITQMQFNGLILPIITSLLTSITILGYYIMFETVYAKNLSIWFLLFTFTFISVTLVQKEIQGILQIRKNPSSHIVFLGVVVFSTEFIIIIIFRLMNPAIILSIIPLISMWIYLKRTHLDKLNTDSKVKKIRRIGLFQSLNVILFVLILAVIYRL